MSQDHFESSGYPLQGHYVSPEQLCVGLYIHLDLGWMQHPFTLSHFKIKDQGQILKIRALNLKKIRYDPSRSDVTPAPIKASDKTPATPEATAPTIQSPVEPRTPDRIARLKQLNHAVLESSQVFARESITVREAIRNLAHHPEQSHQTAERLVDNWVHSAITEGDVALHAINTEKNGHETFVHAMNVTVLSLMLAKSLDMKDEDAKLLGIAAMFHDVGKEDAMPNKSFIDLHCELGARIAERGNLPARVPTIISQHHEYMDGSGLPHHLKGDRIDPLARILALVNHYDNLCNPAKIDEAMTPYEALSVIYATQQSKFDTTTLKLFVRTLGVYPPGAIVQVSNGVFGIVLSSNPDKPMLPVVMLHLPKVARETPVIIDLALEQNLSIKKCIRPEHLPKEVYNYLRPRKRIGYYFMAAGNTSPAAANDTQQNLPNKEKQTQKLA
jgi:putative nucleotidyltransferase with HDIG domain